MSTHFNKHYDLDEARALLPTVRQWLDQIRTTRQRLKEHDQELEALTKEGHDVGGPLADQWVTELSNLKSLINQFQKREIQIKDLDRGLIDFPAYRHGREIFLCWEKAEDDIYYWHDLETGYAGRQSLNEDDLF